MDLLDTMFDPQFEVLIQDLIPGVIDVPDASVTTYYTTEGEVEQSPEINSFPNLMWTTEIIADSQTISVDVAIPSKPNFKKLDNYAVGSLARISGPMLSSNLARTDDLTFDTLLHLDVHNRRIGINTTTPKKTFNVGDLYASNGMVCNTANLGNFYINNSNIQNVLAPIHLNASQFSINNLAVGTNVFTANSISGKLTIEPASYIPTSIPVGRMHLITRDYYTGTFELDIVDNKINVVGDLTINSELVKFSNMVMPVDSAPTGISGMLRYNPVSTFVEVFDTDWVQLTPSNQTITEAEAIDIMYIWSIALS